MRTRIVSRRHVPLFVLLATAGLCACAWGWLVVRMGHSVYTREARLRELRGRQPPNLSFSFRKCPTPGPDQGDYVKEQEWLADGVFRCVINVTANCADEEWVGNYRLGNDNQLVLEYTRVRWFGEDACLCPVEMEYRISNLERRDYTIKIRYVDPFRP